MRQLQEIRRHERQALEAHAPAQPALPGQVQTWSSSVGKPLILTKLQTDFSHKLSEAVFAMAVWTWQSHKQSINSDSTRTETRLEHHVAYSGFTDITEEQI